MTRKQNKKDEKAKSICKARWWKREELILKSLPRKLEQSQKVKLDGGWDYLVDCLRESYKTAGLRDISPSELQMSSWNSHISRGSSEIRTSWMALSHGIQLRNTKKNERNHCREWGFKGSVLNTHPKRGKQVAGPCFCRGASSVPRESGEEWVVICSDRAFLSSFIGWRGRVHSRNGRGTKTLASQWHKVLISYQGLKRWLVWTGIKSTWVLLIQDTIQFVSFRFRLLFTASWLSEYR